MLSEQAIRTIAQRYVEPLRQANAEERRLIIENALREALIADQQLNHHQCVPNAGCL